MNKRVFVYKSFASLAPSYDLANTMLSVGLDAWWRRVAVRALGRVRTGWVLDCCAGTLRLAVGVARRWPGVRVVALDFSPYMLLRGVKRINTLPVFPLCGDAERLPFPDGSFAGAIVGFGLRNLVEPRQGIHELFRVIKEGGKLVTLEFTMPTSPPFKQIYYWYLSRMIPWAGGVISGNKEVYRYLHDSIVEFSKNFDVVKEMETAGFIGVSRRHLTGGVVEICVGEKPSS